MPARIIFSFPYFEHHTIGQLVAFQMFAGRMSQPMLRLVGLWQEFQQADIAVKRLANTGTPYLLSLDSSISCD